MDDAQLALFIDDVVVVERSVRIEDEGLHPAFGAVVPHLRLVYESAAVDEDQAARVLIAGQLLQLLEEVQVREDGNAVVLHLVRL